MSKFYNVVNDFYNRYSFYRYNIVNIIIKILILFVNYKNKNGVHWYNHS